MYESELRPNEAETVGFLAGRNVQTNLKLHSLQATPFSCKEKSNE